MKTRPLKEYIVLSTIYAKTNNTTKKYEPEDIITTKDLPQDMSSTNKFRWIHGQIQHHNLAELEPGKGYIMNAAMYSYYDH